MNFHIITIFPNIFDSYFQESIMARAREKNIINIHACNLRDWADDKRKTVDDAPYGGGAGMLMKIEPLFKAIKEIKKHTDRKKTKIILTSARGKTWNQAMARDYAEIKDLIIICGRYEGVDERIINFIDEEISIGNYVLTGGEIPTMAIIDSITRLLPGALGNEQSPLSESHAENKILEYPQYTRPEIFKVKNKEYKVPEILLSGNHAKIKKWQEKQKRKKPY